MKASLVMASAILLTSATNTFSASQEQGAEKFQQLCSSCHVAEGQGKIAPPMFGIVDHVKRAHPNREDFINYIVNWVPYPDASKALMPGAVKKFGVMPALPFPESDLRIVAEFLYDNGGKMPDWYAEHYQAEHGKSPMTGQGSGKISK